MRLIKNFDALNKTPQRKICLELIETALSSIQPYKVIQKKFSFSNNILSIQNISVNLNEYQRVFLIGFGKGSAKLSYYIEKLLGDKLTIGYDIDLIPEHFTKVNQTIGTHPLPSKANFAFTQNTIQQFNNLTMKDLVIVVIAGGGSALFVAPYKITLEKLIETNKLLLKSGANITEMNIVRKHLDLVKGGGLAKILYPARVISIIASDVPGNDLSTIASGPTVKDSTTKEQALETLKKYNLLEQFSEDEFLETPKEDKYFQNVSNIMLLSNQTALDAMKKTGEDLGLNVVIESDKIQGDSGQIGKLLIDKTQPNQILLAGGETTVKVTQKGEGGRNQHLILSCLPFVGQDTTIVSFDSDGWDNSSFAGAIGDYKTLEKAEKLSINPEEYLNSNNSLSFFQKTGDGIITNRLPSNVSDLMIVLKI